MITDAFMASPDRGCAPGKADPDLFFAPAANAFATVAQKAAASERREQARRQCRRFCPFTEQCFAWAEQDGQRHGFWGGVNMSSEVDRRKHRDKWGIAAAPEPAELSLIDRVLAGTAAFDDLDAADQVAAVNSGIEQGETLESLAGRFGTTAESLQLLIIDKAEIFDRKVKALYEAGKADRDIALSLGVHAKTVSVSRARQSLPALYGPGGRELTAAGRDAREQRLKQQDLIVQRLYEKGLTDDQIVAESGLTYDQVRWTRRRLRMPSKRRPGRASTELREQRKARVRDLHSQGLSDVAIAKQMGVAPSYVNQIRGKWLGLPALFSGQGKRITQPEAVPA